MDIHHLDSNSFLLYQDNFLDTQDFNTLKHWLETQTFETGSTINGSRIDREQLWFQKENKYFCPLWKRRHARWESKEYNKIIDKIQNIVQNYLNEISKCLKLNKTSINSCLVNKYEDGEACITPHSDSSLSFGERPVIIGLSIGDTRNIIFRKKKNNQSKEEFINNPIVFKKELLNNSIFIMTGNSQINYTHEIPKEENKITRYSLTFREMII
jgi:alkylated DNA repair dioxygenase AlkB